MSFVVCIVPVAPLRKESAHRSEMVSQLLFGEVAEVLQETALFINLRCAYDGYEGWCQRSQLIPIDIADLDQEDKSLVAGWAETAMLNDSTMHLSLGTPLAFLKKGMVQNNKIKFSYTGPVHIPGSLAFNETFLKQISYLYLNTGYLWGGRSVFGIDCSGFVQQVFRFFNKPLPRDAWQQAEKGEVVGFLQEALCGDLAFFDNEEGKITHVGMMLNTNTIIHSSGKVRIDSIDNMGIISGDTGERTHNLRIVKRYP
jgi:hypothetical protein